MSTYFLVAFTKCLPLSACTYSFATLAGGGLWPSASSFARPFGVCAMAMKRCCGPETLGIIATTPYDRARS